MKCKNCGHDSSEHTPEPFRPRCVNVPGLGGYYGGCSCPGFVPADSEAAIKQALGKEGEK